jgi:hypothetical protein
MKFVLIGDSTQYNIENVVVMIPGILLKGVKPKKINKKQARKLLGLKV